MSGLKCVEELARSALSLEESLVTWICTLVEPYDVMFCCVNLDLYWFEPYDVRFEPYNLYWFKLICVWKDQNPRECVWIKIADLVIVSWLFWSIMIKCDSNATIKCGIDPRLKSYIRTINWSRMQVRIGIDQIDKKS